jgi:RNA-directed DNA polymerase
MLPEEVPTPIEVRSLQRALYRRAKSNPRWRAWSLYGELCRPQVLEAALRRVLRNKGAPGEDGVTVEAVKANRDAFLRGLNAELQNRTYRPRPVLRVWIKKDDGKERPIGIATVKDRVVQAALVILLQPLFEADFHKFSFGYRPKRHAHQAVETVRMALLQGYREVIDADLSGYFDTIPRDKLMKLVAKRVSDGAVLRLIKLFLGAPIVEEKKGKRTIQPSHSGVPQGGPLSPLLANLYLNGLDHEVNDRGLELKATLVRFADDMVLLSAPGRGEEHYTRLKEYLQRKGLKLNEAKTRVLDANRESFRFVGFQIGMRRSARTGNQYVHIEPSRKSRGRLKDAVRGKLNHWTRYKGAQEVIEAVNSIVRGWTNYFHFGNCSEAFTQTRDWLAQRLRKWLWRKHDRRYGRYTYFTDKRLYENYQLWKMPVTAGWT